MTHPPRRQIPVEKRPSPNHNARRTPIDMIVLHYTGMSSLQEVLQKLCDPASELSAHYVVDEQGNIYRLVDEERRAWHAGVSNWQGQRDINSRSIGIEIMNNGQKPFTRQQISSVISICKSVMERYDIPVYNVVGHSDVAPGRKTDPGHMFPWSRLSLNGIGLHPDATLEDYFATAGKKGDLRHIRRQLQRLGYGADYAPNATPTLRETVAAFQARWEQDAFRDPARVGIPTHRTVALMRALDRAQSAAEAAFTRRRSKRPARQGRPPAP
jgi:N-acetylmuramoyl-L-alanine amidase